ncbi:hypothetical protein VN97_g12701 [Penicillium thymicola]|uniref:Uncharacterized protein n=1 Tax=Penicillium thymicola TaxID=293382 RepID=A0AAI9X1W4_PENTH|nr:hypothetical protein VN97_g12701 [Penicillium thymicola]
MVSLSTVSLSVPISRETTTSTSTSLEQLLPLLLLPRLLTVARPLYSPALPKTTISSTRSFPVISATPSRPSIRSPTNSSSTRTPPLTLTTQTYN